MVSGNDVERQQAQIDAPELQEDGVARYIVALSLGTHTNGATVTSTREHADEVTEKFLSMAQERLLSEGPPDGARILQIGQTCVVIFEREQMTGMFVPIFKRSLCVECITKMHAPGHGPLSWDSIDGEAVTTAGEQFEVVDGKVVRG